MNEEHNNNNKKSDNLGKQKVKDIGTDKDKLNNAAN